jgi:glycine cleavage system H protein
VQVSLPAKGAALKAGDPMASVEATDRTLALPAPIDGEVAEVNDEINDTPELIDTSAEKLAWLVKLKVAAPEQVEALMDRDAYEAYLDTL